MRNLIIFSLPGNEKLASTLAKQLEIELGSTEIREFPDGESYIRIDSNLTNKTAILICTLDHPNTKILPLIFMAQTLKELGATKICVVTPYLPYMRQDTQFKPGEVLTSNLFAKLISNFIDSLITVDPHLHRIKKLNEIYSIPIISTLHASEKIGEWVQKNVDSPFIIGPDEESKQWVAEVAIKASTSYTIMKKIRSGDRSVNISIPDINDLHKTPVLVDDIISTGTSMIAAIQQLLSKGFINPICISIHALFDNEIYNNLLRAGAKRIITCNTIPHFTNKINITDVIIKEIKRLYLFQ